MNTREKPAFYQSIGGLMDSYGKRGEEVDFQRRAAAYFEQLKDFTLVELAHAISQCAYRFDYMPTAGQLAGLCKERRRELAARAKEIESNERSASERRATEDYYRTQVPKTKGAMEAWMGEGATCFDKLARLWECEIGAGLGSMHDQTAWGQDKARELWKLWNRHERGDCSCVSKCDPPEPKREQVEFTYVGQ